MRTVHKEQNGRTCTKTAAKRVSGNLSRIGMHTKTEDLIMKTAIYARTQTNTPESDATSYGNY